MHTAALTTESLRGSCPGNQQAENMRTQGSPEAGDGNGVSQEGSQKWRRPVEGHCPACLLQALSLLCPVHLRAGSGAIKL